MPCVFHCFDAGMSKGYNLSSMGSKELFMELSHTLSLPFIGMFLTVWCLGWALKKVFLFAIICLQGCQANFPASMSCYFFSAVCLCYHGTRWMGLKANTLQWLTEVMEWIHHSFTIFVLSFSHFCWYLMVFITLLNFDSDSGSFRWMNANHFRVPAWECFFFK